MKTRSKALLLSLCAVLLVAVSVFGTMAYLTSEDAVVNTFTVGSVALKLDETDVKPDGTLDTETRVKVNEYHLLPGHTYIKDPTVTVEAESEDAYVRMMVTVENIDQLKAALSDAKYYSNGVFLLQMLCVDENGDCTWDADTWQMTSYATKGNAGVYEFRYKDVVEKSNTATVLPDLFTHITVPSEIDNDDLAKLKDVKINVTAHAIQADGFADATEAWKAFDGDING